MHILKWSRRYEKYWYEKYNISYCFYSFFLLKPLSSPKASLINLKEKKKKTKTRWDAEWPIGLRMLLVGSGKGISGKF